MINPDQIPPEVVEAAAKAAHDKWRHQCAVANFEPVENWREWPELEVREQLDLIEQARAAIAAAINAWPGMNTRHGLYTDIILPLPEGDGQ